MLTELYAGVTDEFVEAVGIGPVVLTGLPGAARADFVQYALLGSHRAELDPLNAGTAAALRQDALSTIVDSVAGSGPRRDWHRALVQAFGGRAGDALALTQGNDAITFSFAEIFRAMPSHTALIVHDAHLLAAPWADRSLWALRARIQEANRPGLILLTRPWHTEALVGVDAPFYGFAQVLGLPVPDATRWAEETEHRIPPSPLGWLLERTRGLPRTTRAVLDLLEPTDRDERTQAELETAWRIYVRCSRSAGAAVRELVRGLHPLAPRLLRAVASGDRVYSSAPGARTDAIAAALRMMRDHDVIYQPGPRRWIIADPALVPHLAARRSL